MRGITTPAEIEQWLTAPADEALELQRPLPVEQMKIVATGVKEDLKEAEAVPVEASASVVCGHLAKGINTA